MTASLSQAAWWPTRAARVLVPRRSLSFVRLPMPGLGRRQLRDAVRLQLTQYMAGAPFGFICRDQAAGIVAAWCWGLGVDGGSPLRSASWPESALDEPASDGLYLRRRMQGFEAQQWKAGELLHSRWFASSPDTEGWQAFARGCGVAPQDHPLPAPSVARTRSPPTRGWLAGDSLPAPDPWQGWRWQAAVMALGALVAAGAGMHLQARAQLSQDSPRLQALRSGREAALQARAHYEITAADLEALRALVPRLSQLELLDRVTASGVFQPVALSVAAGPANAASAPPRAQLLEWDYRNGQLRLTLEFPERDIRLLDVTRRIEKVPGLGALRVGQDSADNTLSLTASVTDLATETPPR